MALYRLCPINVKRLLSLKSIWCSQSSCVHHIPVLKNEVNHYLEPSNKKIILDMTFGGGGHTMNLLLSAPNMKIICLDRDPESYETAKVLCAKYPEQIIPCLGKFSDIPSILNKVGIDFNSLDGILFDFGCSSMQMDSSRGFSISRYAPLDMRMEGNSNPNHPTAADVIKYCDETDLVNIFKIYGEEKLAKKVARSIIETRYTFNPIKTTQDLTLLVANIFDNRKSRIDKLQRPAHIATKIFQALRIFVNNELNEINHGINIAHRYLKIGGRLVTITFHSLEDRIIKKHLTGLELEKSPVPLKYRNYSYVHNKDEMDAVTDNKWIMLNKHVITPSYEEIEANPRSRSAKLRAAIKVS